MNKLFFLIPLLSVAFIPLAMAQQAPSQPVLTIGQNYDLLEDYQLGVATWSSHTERIFDGSDWKEFIVYDRSDIVQVESNSIGSLVYDKNSCSYSIYENGYVTSGTQIIPSVSWMPRIAEVGTNNYSEMTDLFNQQCTVSVQQGEDWVKITSVKVLTEDLDPVVVIHANGTQSVYPSGTRDIATVTQTLDIKTTNGIKETVSVYNGNPNWNNHKFALSQTVHTGDSITLAGNTYDIAAASGTVLDRTWIEDNEAQIFQIADSLSYDFDIGFTQLNAIQILNDGVNKVSMDFSVNESTPYLSSYTVDPTFTQGNTNDARTLNNGYRTQLSQQFETGHTLVGTNISEFTVYAKLDSGSPTGTLYARIWDSSGNVRETSSTTYDVSTFTSTITDKAFTFSGIALASGDMIGLEFNGGSSGNNPNFRTDTTNPDSNAIMRQNIGSGWADVSSDDMKYEVDYLVLTQPSAPTSLSAVSGQPIELDWTASSDLGGAATGDMTYKVERADYEFAQQPLPINAGSDSGVNMSTNVLLYHLDATKIDSTTTIDSSKDGTNNGATTGQTGKLGNAWDFDGSNDYVSIPFGTQPDKWSMAFWVYPTSVSNYEGILNSHGHGGGVNGYRLELDGNNDLKLQWNYNNANSGHTHTISTNIVDDQWYHLVITGNSDDGEIISYLNGANDVTTSFSNWSETHSSSGSDSSLASFELGVGYSSSGERWFSGSIDQFLYYNTILDSTTIGNLYNSGSGTTSPSTTNLIAHYDFEQTGSTLENQSTITTYSDPYIEDTSGANNDSEDPAITTTNTPDFDTGFDSDSGWTINSYSSSYVDINQGGNGIFDGDFPYTAYDDEKNYGVQAVYDLGSVDDEKWILRFEWKGDYWENTSVNHLIGITSADETEWSCDSNCAGSDKGDEESIGISTGDPIALRMGHSLGGSGTYLAETRDTDQWTGLQQNTWYWIEIKRLDADTARLTVWDDAFDGNQVFTDDHTVTGVDNLQYIKFSKNGRAGSYEIDNTSFYDGVTSVSSTSQPTFSVGTIANQIDSPQITVKSTTLYDGTDSHTVGGWTSAVTSATGTMFSFENTAGEKVYYEVEADKLRVAKDGTTTINIPMDSLTGWNEEDSSAFSLNTGNEQVDWDTQRDGTNNAITYNLGQILPTAWTLQYELTFDNNNSGGGNWVYVGIVDNDGSVTHASAQDGIATFLMNEQNTSAKQRHGIPTGDDAVACNGNFGLSSCQSYNSNVQYSTGTKYYITLERVSSTESISTVRTGSHTGTVHDTFTKSDTAEATGLQYFRVSDLDDNASGGDFDGVIENVSVSYQGKTNIIEATGQTISSSTPSHIQFNRGTSNDWSIYLDGTSVATNTDSTSLGTVHGALTLPSYETDFSSDSGWVQTGSEVSITGGVVDIVNADTNTEHTVSYDLGTALSSQFVFDFDFDYQGRNGDANHPLVSFTSGSTSDSNKIYTSGENAFGIMAQWSGAWAGNRYDGSSGSDSGSSSGMSMSTGTTYYMRGIVDMSAGTLKIQQFTDSSRTGTPTEYTWSHSQNYNDLDTIVIHAYTSDSASKTIDGQIDNLKICDGTTTMNCQALPSYYIGQSPSGTNTLPSLDEFYVFTSDKDEASDIYQRGSNVFAQVGSTSGSTVTHSDNNSLVSGDTYYHRIVANNGAFDSDPSNVTSATAGVPPDAPTNLQAAINNPNTAPLEVTLTWTDGAGQGTGTFQNYIVIRSPDSTFTSVSTVGTPTATTFTDTVPSGGGTFYYKVSDQATHGGSPNSSAANVTTPTVPDAPTISLAINNPDPSPLTITTTFTPPGNNGGSSVTGYHLFHSGDNVTFTQVATGVAGPHDHTVSGVGTHYFKAQAVNLVGASVDSATQSIATPTAPSSPASLTVTLPDVDTAPFTVTLDWTAPTSDGGSAVTGYKVYRDSALIDTLGNVLTLNNTAPSNASTVFNFEVTSLNNAGESTAVAQSWTSPAVPSQVQGVSGTMINSNVVLTWATPQSDSAITDYQVIRDGSPLGLVGSDATTYTDSNNVQPDQSIVYTVKGISLVGTGSASAGTTVSTGSAAVLDLSATNVIGNSLVLTWTEPTYSAGTVTGYQINYTQSGQFGEPNVIVLSDTESTSTVLPLSSLGYNQNYTWSVGVITPSGVNATGNWYNVTTGSDSSIVSANVTSGIDLDATNTNELEQIKFVRTDNTDGTTTLDVIHPNYYTLECNMQSKFAMTNQNYTSLPTTVVDGNDQKATFVFTGLENEIITVKCTDTISKDDAQHILTQSQFPFLTQISNFTNGTYGTMGQFGAVDLVSLAGIIIAMIGFNRVNHVVGGFFAIVMFFVLGYFQIIQTPTAIVGGIATTLMLLIASQRKK